MKYLFDEYNYCYYIGKYSLEYAQGKDRVIVFYCYWSKVKSFVSRRINTCQILKIFLCRKYLYVLATLKIKMKSGCKNSYINLIIILFYKKRIKKKNLINIFINQYYWNNIITK